MLFIFTNCENDTEIFLENDNLNNSQKPVIVEQIIINNIPTIANIIIGLSYRAEGINNRKENPGFSIDTERIIQATDSIGNITYAFEILTIDTPDNILYNLIVTQKNNGKKIPAFIIKYEFENATKYDYSAPTEGLKFEAKTSIYSYEKFIQTTAIDRKSTANRKLTPNGTEPCIELNNNSTGSNGGGGYDNLNGANFNEQTNIVGGIGGFGIYVIPQNGGSGGGKRASVICGELTMLPLVNSLNRSQNKEEQARGTKDPASCPEGEILLPINKNPTKIINNLNGKERCIDNLLTENGTDFVKNLLKNFDGVSEFDIIIKSVTTIINPITKKESGGLTYSLNSKQ